MLPANGIRVTLDFRPGTSSLTPDVMRLALALEYDGRPYCGFQSQPSRCGVQHALEHALREIAQRDVAAIPRGRTDAGVHAVSQIAHADVPENRPLTAWVRGVNAHLPPTVAALWARGVPDAFHAPIRRDGSPLRVPAARPAQRPGLMSGRVGWYHRPLDVDAMREAASLATACDPFLVVAPPECQVNRPVKPISLLLHRRRPPHAI